MTFGAVSSVWNFSGDDRIHPALGSDLAPVWEKVAPAVTAPWSPWRVR